MKIVVKICNEYKIMTPYMSTTYTLYGMVYHNHTKFFHNMSSEYMEFDNGVFVSCYEHKTFGVIASFSTKYRKERFK